MSPQQTTAGSASYSTIVIGEHQNESDDYSWVVKPPVGARMVKIQCMSWQRSTTVTDGCDASTRTSSLDARKDTCAQRSIHVAFISNFHTCIFFLMLVVPHGCSTPASSVQV